MTYRRAVLHRSACTWLMVASVFAGLLLTSNAYGQATTSLRGTVTDPSGSVVPNATVVLTEAESKHERSTTTGAQGAYQFNLLPPGTYTLAVTAPGFQRYETTELQLLVNTPATANVALKVGRATETVTVSGEAPALNMVDASMGVPFDETQVKEIPLEGRNVPDLLSLQAGVTYFGNGNNGTLDRPSYKDQDTRNGAVNGARSDQSNVTLDGVDVNDRANGYAFTSVVPVTPDSVQEFRVTTTNYHAEEGVGSGAQVTLVTKSGTNRFHGSVYEYLRNTLTSANDYFTKQSEAALGQPNEPPKLIRNNFGASVGGPIKKDRLFFFLNYEGTRRREQESVIRNIPTQTMRDGVIEYVCAVASQCPGGQVVNGFTGTYTMPAGMFGLGPTQLTALDPLNRGPNATMMSYFNQTFGGLTPNDPSVGDGFNYSGFRFPAPILLNNNIFIGRVDYHLTADGKHTLFWRGSLWNQFNPQAPFLPGTPPEEIDSDHSRGFVVGYTALLSSDKVNSFHWGWTRQSYGVTGNTNVPWNTFYTLDQGFVYGHNFRVTTNNLIDDFSWTKGTHTLQFGGGIGIARDPRVSQQHSFSIGKGATFWMAPVGFANTGGQSPLDPVNGGFPEPGSSIAYDYPMLGMLGIVSDVVMNINYDRNGNTLAQGTPIARDYGLNWYEFYAQDSWRIKPNLTVTYGLRWSLAPPPWELNGLQASPTFDLGQYFNQNVVNMQQGKGYADAPLMSFVLGGPANNGPGFYHFEKSDFSPRLAVAWSPRPSSGWLRKIVGSGDKTVIRAGVGRVYDRAGMELINTFDALAPAGLSATIQDPCCVPGFTDAANSPRVGTSVNTIPTNYSNGLPVFVNTPNPPFPQLQIPPGAFPQTPAPFGNAITWGVDQSLKTPFAYTADFSVARELPHHFTVQVAYVGRFGRHLLTQRDLTQPLDLVDPKTGIDYYAAAAAISQLARQGVPVSSVNNSSVGATAAFWLHTLPPLAPGAQYVLPSGGTTSSLIQEVYALYTTTDTYAGDEVVGLANIDLYGYLFDTLNNVYYFNGKPGELLNGQATSMYAWSSIGSSNYNALQLTVRKQLSSGIQFDLNYTYSKSIDITSAASRLSFSPSDNIGAPATRLVNAFNPRLVRAVSDFDLPHQINANWIAELPFGRGKPIGRGSGAVLNGFIGGWQWSGVGRWTSGFPFTIDNGQFWPTDWDYQGMARMIATPQAGAFHQPNGSVSVFANPTAAINDFIHPFPGDPGSRNTLRGDGFAGLDMSLSKRWQLPAEGHSIQFRWEVFNVFNLTRFNVAAGLGDNAPSLQQLPGNFGDYTGLLTQPRVMQFALRYEF